MTELSELSDYYPSSLAKLSININNEKEEKEEINQIRCPICSSLASIIEANFKTDFFSITCQNDHEDIFINFDSFSSFFGKVLKNIENILCNNCKKSKNEVDIYRCDKCYLFLCEECKILHQNNLSHLNYTNINDIDNNDINDLIISKAKKPKKNEINKEYHNIKNNIDICKKIHKSFNEWIKELTKKFNDYMILLNNYLSLEKVIVSNLNKYYDMEEMNFNNSILQNYEILYPNKYFINNYIQSLNIKLNSINKSSLKERSLLFIKIIQNFDEIDDYFQLNQKPLDLTNKSKSENLYINNKINFEEKISDMKKLKLDLEGIKCFNSFMNDKLLLLGNKEGILSIYEINQKKGDKEEILIFKKHLKIFEDEIRNICIINNNIIIISDGEKLIKILNINEELNFEIIQEIFLKNPLYDISPLEIHSEKIISKYFYITENNNIIIFKENLIKNEKNFFSEFKTIQLKTLIISSIEVDNKYLVVSCPKVKKIIFFDINNDFKEAGEIKEINISNSRNNLLLIHENSILVVGTLNGFELISIKNLYKIKSIHCKYSVISLGKINENTIVCCNDDKNNKNKMRQFNVNDINYNFKKISEKIFDDNDEIYELKLINGKIFFLNKCDELNYLL